MKRYAVIVDGYHVHYGDSRGFASAFAASGVTPVTVMSTPEPLPKYVKKAAWHPEDFEAVHFYDGDFDKLVDLVRGYQPVCIVPENEAGVELAAELVDVLLPGAGNVPGTARSQRDKGVMAQTLALAGVPGPATISTSDPDAVADWIRANGLADRPLIVKPPHSGGTDNVHLVPPGRDWRQPFDTILGSFDCFNLRNDTVIVQDYLEGPEYIVDLYSVDGRHGLVDVCAYTKHIRDTRIGIYDTADFLPPDDPDVAVLAEYTMRAADALGIRNGSTHAEVILTADGPRLVELGARYAGSCMMLAGLVATGDNQIQRTVRHVLEGDFTPGYNLVRPTRTVWLCADQAGPARDTEVLQAISDLPTVEMMSVPYPGKVVPETFDLGTILGWVIQAAGDWAAIEDDHKRIRELERIWNACQVDEPAHAG
jgi:hypothetical protein